MMMMMQPRCVWYGLDGSVALTSDGDRWSH